MWIQEHGLRTDKLQGKHVKFEGRKVGRLEVILKIQEMEREFLVTGKNGQKSYPAYTGAFVDVFDWVDGGKYGEITGMPKVKLRAPETANPRRYIIGTRKFYEVSKIIHAVDLWPVSLEGDSVFYVSPWTDFEAFNFVVAPDFMSTGHRVCKLETAKINKKRQEEGKAIFGWGLTEEGQRIMRIGAGGLQ